LPSLAILQGPAQAVTPSEIAELSDEEARALFRQYRFLANDGQPYCLRCGCLVAWTYKDGRLFKCKGCLKQFTLTTNTPFSYHKLSFKAILQILSQFAIAYQGRSAREILRDLRKIKHYKTVFVWLHKVRFALKKQEQSRVLSGEVEIDGKEMGGYIRPKNARLEKTDHWKFPFRAADRKLWVTLARARTGPARSWVCREEEHAVTSFKKSLEPGTVVYSDSGNWGEIRGGFELRQVTHRQHFYTAESCTNHAESANNVLGVMERIFRHITGRYLDAYAAQLAWRMTCVPSNSDANFADLMKAMVNGGRSPMTGYFLPKSKGGTKRQCEVVNPDGSIGWWRPPTAEERRRHRERGRDAAGRPKTPLLRDARSASRWSEDFTYLPAAAFLSDPKLVPTSPPDRGRLNDRPLWSDQLRHLRSPGRVDETDHVEDVRKRVSDLLRPALPILSSVVEGVAAPPFAVHALRRILDPFEFASPAAVEHLQPFAEPLPPRPRAARHLHKTASSVQERSLYMNWVYLLPNAEVRASPPACGGTYRGGLPRTPRLTPGAFSHPGRAAMLSFDR